MAVNLSAGVISELHNGIQPEEITLQVLAIRKFPTGDRCRLMVSDGVYQSGFAILASQLNNLVSSGEVAPQAIVKITRYFCNNVTDKKKMMIILEMNVLLSAEDAGGIIGDPKAYDKGAENSTGAAPQASAAAPARPQQPQVPATPAALVKPNMTSAGKRPAEVLLPQAPAGMPNVRPISTLSPYQSKWTICARVTNKSDIKTWSNPRGTGKRFSMDLLDESGEIRATAFKAECDKYYDMIEANRVYYISGANVGSPKKQFSSPKNDYEIIFNSNTRIAPCHEPTDIPTMQYEFVTLEQLEGATKDTIVDVVAVCRDFADISTVPKRTTGEELIKRDITLVDDTNRSISVTLWGEQAQKFDGSGNPVLAIRSAKVSDFGGVSLSLLSSSSMQLNPDISEAHQLKGWWEHTGCTATDTISLSTGRGASAAAAGTADFKTFLEAKREGLGSHDQPDYYACKATVMLVRKENMMYTACPNEGCNKKVLDMSNGMYRCDKCDREFNSFKWRYVVSCNVADFTENQWVTLFQEQAETLLGISSQELAELKEKDPDKFQKVVLQVTFKDFLFRIEVKMGTFNGESRLNTQAVIIQPINPVEYNKRLVKEIRELAA